MKRTFVSTGSTLGVQSPAVKRRSDYYEIVAINTKTFRKTTTSRFRRCAAAALVALATAACALTRSEVKALRDRDASRIALDTVIPTTVTALNELPSHCGPAGNRRRSEQEFRVYQVVGRITRVRRERDRDVHIVLEDLDHPRDRLVIELADPDTRSGRKSPYRDRLAAAQTAFGTLEREFAVGSPRELEGRIVRVTGVGFFDFYHFQRGRSRSCIELHPVLSMEPAAK